jgi:hypothetical protein
VVKLSQELLLVCHDLREGVVADIPFWPGKLTAMN